MDLQIIENCPKKNRTFSCLDCIDKERCLKRLTMPVIDDEQAEFNQKHQDEVGKAFDIFR